MCYAKFAYPLANVHGTLAMDDGVWTFSKWEGGNDTARVNCGGSLAPGPQGNELVLNLTGRDVLLVKDLRQALNERMQRAWDDLQPHGVVDFGAQVRYLPEQKKFSIALQLEPQRETASIEPCALSFPHGPASGRHRLSRRQGKL